MRRRFRRNPIAVTGFLNNTIVPAAVGAGGAIATDMIANQLAWYLPASLQTPAMRPVTNIGISLLLGWGVGKVAGQKLGNEAAAGGIVVALYNFFNQQLAGFGQGYGLGYDAAGFAYSPNGYGATMNRYMNGMGYLRRRPAPIGVSSLDVTTPRLLNGGPYNQTKFRMMRNGQAEGTMGYISPARTLGRYVANGR